MDKWDYISLISKRGDRYGYNGGVHDLLTATGKRCTMEITEYEAIEFYNNGGIGNAHNIG